MRVLGKVAIGVGVVVLLAGGIAGYLWHQATALPDWYTEVPKTELAEYSGAQADSEGAEVKWIAFDQEGERLEEEVPLEPEAPRGIGGVMRDAVGEEAMPPPDPPQPEKETKRSGKAKRHELRGFHRGLTKRRKRKKDDAPLSPAEKAAREQAAKKKAKAVRASRAVYENGHLEVGVILDLSDFPADKLNERDRTRYERAVKNFPGLTNRDVWVGVEDDAVIVDGYLQLGADAKVRVGKLTYSLAGAAKRLGMKPEQLLREVNRELRRAGFVDPDTR